MRGDDAYALNKKYTDSIVTGDISVTKNSDGSITFSANGGKSYITLTADEVRGRGIKSAVVNDSGNLIVTYTDNETVDLGLIKGKHAEVKIKDNTEYKTTLELTNYDSNGNAIKETTPNLKAPKVTITENSNNADMSYKLDVNTYDEEGNIAKTITTPNMKPVEYDVKPNAGNNAYSYKTDTTKKDETGTTTITSSNLKGNFIWNGTDLTGDNIVFEVLADDGINYSRVNDLYINTETSDLYQRTDKRNVNNTWERIGNFKGLEGDDAYEVAISEGFVGTRSEWLKSLTGESLGSDIVFSKPNLYDEKTLIKKWYYYKVDNAKYGEGTAWYNRYNIPSNKDYPPHKYTFFNGINYLNFETTENTIPALTNKDTHEFYVLYDEKLNKSVAHMITKETGEDVVIGDWIDVTTSINMPEGAELVENDGNVIQYGDWVQTIYLGSSKDNAKECTITTGVDVSGFITSEEFNEVIGTGTLDTNNKDIKRAINELLGYLKANKDTVLNTDNKTVFEAINELFGKHYMDCFELVDSNLLTHCLSLEYRTLSSNFIYCENCTGVPLGNNGYGYAMLVVSQDTHYRQIVFFDPSTGRINTNNIGANADNTDFGEWSGWGSATNEEAIGTVKAYYGRHYGLTIPYGWALCDGSVIDDENSPLNGQMLPDMRNRVLAMANTETDIGTTAGEDNITLNRDQLPNVNLSGSTTYTPSGSISSNGSHSHSYGRISNTYSRVKIDANDNWGYTGQWNTGTTGSAGSHNHTFYGNTGVVNISNISLNGGVTQQTIDNRQSTIYIDYIMKIK